MELERKIASVKSEKLPRAVQAVIESVKRTERKFRAAQYEHALAKYSIYGATIKPRNIEVAEQQLNDALLALSNVVKKHLSHSDIRKYIERGATHVHPGVLGNKLHFVRLSGKYRKKVYKPILGSHRIPIYWE